MRKLYTEFFYIPKHGKIREKVMLARVAVTIAVMLACLAAMSFSAYAYFSYDIASGANIIKAAHFETTVSIQITDKEGNTVDIKPLTSNYQSHKVELEAGKPYTVTITPTEKSTAKTGFVVVTANGCKETYHTQQLGVDANTGEGRTASISFKLLLTDKTTVYFLAHWGTSSYYDDYKNKGDKEELYITQSEQVEMVVNGKKKPATNEQKEPDGTTSSSTDASTSQTAKSTTESTTETTKSTDNTTTSTTARSTDTTEPATTASTTETTERTEPSTTRTTQSTTTHTTEMSESSETSGATEQTATATVTSVSTTKQAAASETEATQTDTTEAIADP